MVVPGAEEVARLLAAEEMDNLELLGTCSIGDLVSTGVSQEAATQLMQALGNKCKGCATSGNEFNDMSCLWYKMLLYCPRACQSVHWKGGHKKECGTENKKKSDQPGEVSSTMKASAPGEHPPPDLCCSI